MRSRRSLKVSHTQTSVPCGTLNSNMTLTVLNLHQKTDPKVQQDFKGPFHFDKVKGPIKVTPG